jgi:hypothetical protein
MPDLTPTQSNLSGRTPGLGTIGGVSRLDRQTSKALARLEQRTVLRQASVLAESVVQLTKLQEIDRLAREAAGGQAMLIRWRETLAAGDPLTNDELRYFTDLARAAKAEVLMDTVNSFCRESNR